MKTIIKKYRHDTILIEAEIFVRTLAEIGWCSWVGVQYDTRLGFYVGGVHYDGVVEECDGIIAPGTSGTVKFVMLSDAILETGLQVGSTVELRGGSPIVATGIVISIEPIVVVSDGSGPKGYSIRRSEQ